MEGMNNRIKSRFVREESSHNTFLFLIVVFVLMLMLLGVDDAQAINLCRL